MAGLERLSIRTVLWGALFLIGAPLIIISMASAIGALHSFIDARRVNADVTATKALFVAMQAARHQRVNYTLSLPADHPADAAMAASIADNDSIVRTNLAAAMPRLAELAELATQLRALREASAALAALRPSIDAALQQSKEARDPSLAARAPKATLALIDALVDACARLDAGVNGFNPLVDRLLDIKQAAWDLRSYAGNVALRSHLAMEAARPWTHAETLQTAEEQGLQRAAWQLIRTDVSRPGTPPSLMAAANDAAGWFAGPLAEEIESVNADLGEGRVPAIGVNEFRDRMLRGINLFDVLANSAIEEALIATTAQEHGALVRLVGFGTVWRSRSSSARPGRSLCFGK